MYIKRVTVKQVGPHELLDLQLTHGVVGCLGQNGAGKSTLLSCIFYAFTGSTARLGDTKELAIRDTAPPGTESSVKVEIEHEGVEYEIFRGLRVPRGMPAHVLIIRTPGTVEEVYDKAADVQAELQKRLKIDPRLVGTYVLVEQGHLCDFLTQAPADRAAAFQALNGTGKAEKIYQAIGDFLSADPALADDGTEDQLAVDRLAEQVEADHVVYAAAAGEQEQAEKDLLTQELEQKARRIAIKKREYDRLSAEFDQLKPRVDVAKASHAATHLSLLAATAKHDEAVAKRDALRPAADKAKVALARHEEFRKAATTREVLKTRLQQFEVVSKAKGPAPTMHGQAGDRDALLRRRGVAYVDWRNLDARIKMFAVTGTVACPTCGTPMAVMAESLAADRIRHGELAAEVKLIDATVGEIDESRLACEQYASWKMTQDALIQGVTVQLEALPAPGPDAGDAARNAETVRAFEAAEKEAVRREAAASAAEAARSSAAATFEQYSTRAAETLTNMEKNAVKADVAERAAAALVEHERAVPLAAAAKARAEAANAAMARSLNELVTARLKLARNQKARAIGAHLRQLREEVFHKHKLPRAVAAANLAGVEHDINVALEPFGSPFQVSVNAEDLSFSVKFPGAPLRNADRLSGGQQAVLGVAFFSAMGGLFEADLGLMALDEPTAGMSEQNVSYLADALARYAESSRGRRQLIIISHSPTLVPALDQVVEIGAGDGA